MISFSALSRTDSMGTLTLMSPSAWMPQELRCVGEVIANPIPDDELTAEESTALAEAERERLASEAYDAGYMAGQMASANAAETQLRGVMDALRAAASQLAAMETTALGDIEGNLAALAVSVARQIIGREVRTSPEVIVDLVRLALTEFPVDQALRIRINPLDLSSLSAATSGSALRIAPDRDITWVADPRVLSGGCLVEGRVRIIDGRVDLALERTYRALTQMGT
ncbi:hypothetical protein BH09GEM1_BH09GEM1_12290 [soil metagenome]